MCRNTGNNLSIHDRANSLKKLMTKFFNKFKNPLFGPFLANFPYFLGKKFFPENPFLSHTTS